MGVWRSEARLRARRLFGAVPLAVVVAGGAALVLHDHAGRASGAGAAHVAALTAPALAFWAMVLAVAMERLRMTGWASAALAGAGVGFGWTLFRLAVAPDAGGSLAGAELAAAGAGSIWDALLLILRDWLATIRQAPLIGMLTALVIRAAAFAPPGEDGPFAPVPVFAAARG